MDPTRCVGEDGGWVGMEMVEVVLRGRPRTVVGCKLPTFRCLRVEIKDTETR